MKGKLKLLILLYLISVAVLGGMLTSSGEKLDINKISTNSVAYLEINGNSGFSSYPGNGTTINPYIIENLTIVGNGSLSRGIYIHHTDAYFIIRGCNITGFASLISLANVTHGSMDHNNLSHGIGIKFNYAHHNNITANRLINTEGIHLDTSHNNTISLNTIAASATYGLFIVLSHENRILGNTISNQTYGISMELSNYNLIQGNTFNCTQTPWFEYSSCVGNQFLNNTIITCNNLISGFGIGIVIPLLILFGWRKLSKK